jgi:hypothetical protein
MTLLDTEMQIALRRQELLADADRERLLAQLPRHQGGVRQAVALACVRVANWLDAPAGYVQLPDPGPEDLTAPWVSV